MSSKPSQGQSQQAPRQGNILSPRSGKGTSPSPPDTGAGGKSPERGDNNRSPRQEPQAPGRSPQRQQSESSRRVSLDEDEDSIDTQPNTAVDTNPASRI